MPAPNQPVDTCLGKDPLGSQPSGEQHHWKAGAGVGAATHEVEVVILIVAVMGPQIAHLQEVVAQAERRAFLEVVEAKPVSRSLAGLELQMLLKIGQPIMRKAPQDCRFRAQAQGLPVLWR